MPPYFPDLERLLTAGSRYAGDEALYVVEPVELDPVVLPTGQVAGCDPLVDPDTAAFTVTVDPGRYPLTAWVAQLFQDDILWQHRTAALQLRILDEPATDWEPALLPGQRLADLDDGEYFGYGVDSGTGALADPVALRALAGWEYERLEDAFIPDALPAAPTAIAAVTDDPTGANVVTVSTGWGDGIYPTFVGRTATGDVACLVTDFMVVPQPDDAAR